MSAQKSGDRVVVAGLAEFRRALRQLDERHLTDGLKAANRGAAQIVVDRAQPSMAGAGGIGGRLAGTMRAGNVQSRGQLSLSSVRGRSGRFVLPLGAEFGAVRDIDRVVTRRGRQTTMKGWNQFQPWRRNGDGAGYHIFPAMRAEQARIMEQYGDELRGLMREAFPD